MLDADAENSKVINLYRNALKAKLSDTNHHVGEHTLHGTRRERSVVARHVLGETVDADGLGDGRTGVILAVRLRHLLVLVFVQIQ